eukprot:TRINITY_DN25888_c0_g1_i1.p1 TRINITY_DN25888_c0_g1~~TRINITY_DN25888_c0_g1_i1.p1  ORF type:complete len:323 (+),score=109.91 TRINITY_DN25888_c0_g1_i1:215-1183(+)
MERMEKLVELLDEVFAKSKEYKPRYVLDDPPTKGEHERDVMPLLKEAADDLNVGQLIHNERFALQEAMSSLEIMDPKMDTGMSTSEGCLLVEALERGLLPADTNLSVLEKIAIMDHLIVMLVGYIGGNPAVQTIFACLYLHENLRHTKDPLFRSFCLGILRSTGIIREVIMAADVYQEEDFLTVMNDFDTCTFVSDADLSKILLGAEEVAMENLRACKKAKKPEGYKPYQEAGEKEESISAAVLSRLQFIRALFTAHINMRKSAKLASKNIVTVSTQLEKMLSTHLELFNACDPPASGGKASGGGGAGGGGRGRAGGGRPWR